MTEKRKKELSAAVKKVVEDYGEVLIKLGQT